MDLLAALDPEDPAPPRTAAFCWPQVPLPPPLSLHTIRSE